MNITIHKYRFTEYTFQKQFHTLLYLFQYLIHEYSLKCVLQHT